VSFLKLLVLFFKSFPGNVECFVGSLKFLMLFFKSEGVVFSSSKEFLSETFSTPNPSSLISPCAI
jgi:hypothetical protein